MKNYSTLINETKKEDLNLNLRSKFILVFLLFTIQFVRSQTVHINPTTNGGFESGATFAANGWNVTTGTSSQNQWVCHTGATAGFSGSRCAYITNNASAITPPHNYTLTVNRRTHLYRDVSILAGETNIILNFNWIGRGQNNTDWMRVWAIPTSYIPAYGVLITTTVPAAERVLLGNFQNQASWTNTTVNVPSAFAGQSFRLVFEWINNNSSGTQPPAAIDNISLTSIVPPINDNCSNAIALTVNEDATCASSTPGTTIGATLSQTGCTGVADDDVWYSFVATSTSHTVTVTPGTLNDAVLQVFSGTCGGLTSLICRDANFSSAEIARVNYLTVGNTYYVRVYSYNNNSGNGTFEICVTSPDTVSTSTTSHTVVELVKDILFENSCISVSNITSVTGTNYGNSSGIGYFSRVGESFPFKDGIVLSTGNANLAGGSINDATNSDGNFAWLGDSDVEAVMSAVSGSPQTSHNASYLQFDFVPFQDTISFDFLFASNEYGQYQCDYSDTFIFLLTNLTTGVTTNIAVVPSTTTPITVVSIRDQLYNGFCSSVNESYFGNYYYNDPISAPINFRGTTVPLTAIGTVVPGQQYRIKLAIADRADPLFDSAVFIKGSSFSLGEIALGDDLFIVDNTALCYGESVMLNPGLDSSIFDFEWYQDDVLISSATGPTFNVTEWGDFRVVAYIKGNPQCYVEDQVRIEIFPEITPLQPRNITRCNFGVPFDLTENNSRLLQFYPEPTFGLNYFTSLADAHNNTNPILNPESFSETSNPQTIYARVYNIERECYGIRSFTVRRPKTWNGSANTDWNTPSNWTPFGVPTDEDCVIINATANDPIISGTDYIGNGFNLEVRDGSLLTVRENNHLMVVDQVVVRPTGRLEFENNASLVQVNNVTNTGSIRYDRKAFIRRLDYVYWSSPVDAFHIASLSPGTPASTRFFWNTTLSNTNGGIGGWSAANENMIQGKGYIVRGPNSFTTTIQEFRASFSGVPNNGTISYPISRGSYTGSDYAGTNGVTITNMDDNFNLIGNPYPSAIRYTDFMAANPDLEGSIRIWTHGTLPSAANGNPFYASFGYNYSSADYIIHNGTGTVTGPATYDGYIPAGQSFFVLMNDGAEATSNVVFTNSMRVTANNTQFYRSSNQTLSAQDSGRIWLDLINPANMVCRTLIGYVEGATNEKDRIYDTYTKISGSTFFYSLIGNEKNSIQGRSVPFEIEDVVPVGFKANAEGNYTIAIAAVDGIFQSEQFVYLKDNLLGIIHELSSEPYTFYSLTGEHNERFEIIYTNETLGTIDFESQEIKVVTNENLTVYSMNALIKEVAVYDVLGRKINHYFNINANEISLKEQKTNQALILKITLENEIIVNKKILY
ncbi:choice-of-anchor L domain-containing protein [Flavobacterium lacus]|uniref:MAM domain-containing protein n=1 Tax=Flavobacterium lacus TaxID=1353778 RepID=A0A328WR31_9FLAO|nr:choice-of-anchor L domain-containing protein [Flavobacterium lacus]RAR47546.1 hypothetical protein B0I10_10846 [Flavobacterium lacus]